MAQTSQAFRDGHSSYPNKRINYPCNDIWAEKDWLDGFYLAEKEHKLDVKPDGDIWCWDYRQGD